MMHGKSCVLLSKDALSRSICPRKIWEASQKLTSDSSRPMASSRLCQVTQDAWEGMTFLQNKLHAVEDKLAIEKQWTPDSLEYQHAKGYVHIHTYQRAVDKLEGLVVQSLFELTKANVSQTGENIVFVNHVIQTHRSG